MYHHIYTHLIYSHICSSIHNCIYVYFYLSVVYLASAKRQAAAVILPPVGHED